MIAQKLSNKVMKRMNFSKKETDFVNKAAGFILPIALFLGYMWIVFRIYARLGFEKTIVLQLAIMIFTLKDKWRIK